MTVPTEWTRDEAKALYDAAIYKMQREPERGHLWDATWQLRIRCGMSDNSYEAMHEVDAAIEKRERSEQKMTVHIERHFENERPRKQSVKKRIPAGTTKFWPCCGDNCKATNVMPYYPETNNGWVLKGWQTVLSRRGWMCAVCTPKYPEGD